MSSRAPERIFVAGHRGMVGAALVRALRARGDCQLVLRSHEELDLCDAAAVDAAGTDAYCARRTGQESQTVWSPIPERLRNPAPAPPATPGVP